MPPQSFQEKNMENHKCYKKMDLKQIIKQNALIREYSHLSYIRKNDAIIIIKLFMTLVILHIMTIMLIVNNKRSKISRNNDGNLS